MASSSEKRKNWTADLLDDLTHLEVNTIIKFGMTAAAPPDTPEEMVSKLVRKYTAKLENILNKNDVDLKVSKGVHTSIERFHSELEQLQEQMDNNGIRLDESDYILYLRFVSFCMWANSKNDNIKIENQVSGAEHDSKKLYHVDLENHHEYSFKDLSPKDKAKIKRLYDLGTEPVVLQTRFSIDGDIVTRIEQEFANSPRSTVMNLHEKHTNMSLNYWERMIKLAINVIKEMVS